MKTYCLRLFTVGEGLGELTGVGVWFTPCG